MIPRRSSIERKVLLAMLAVAITGIALVAGILLASGWRNVRRDRIARAQILVDMVASNCASAIVFNDEKVAEQILSGASADPTTKLAAVYTEDGKIFARFPRTLAGDQFPPPGNLGFVYAGDYLDGTGAVMMKGKRVGTVFLRMDLTPMRRRFQLYVWTTLGCMAVATLGALLLARYLQRRIVDPILSLYRTAKTIAEKRDFSIRAEKRSTDEIGDLVDAFNAMVRDIEDAHAKISGHAADLEREVEERTRRLRELVSELETFSYTVSHDLRAPLRAIIGFGELALEPDSTPEVQQEFLTRSLRAARRMDRLVTDLLRYTRISKADLVVAPVELDRVVGDVLTEYFQVRQAEVEIAVRGPLGTVIGDEAALVQVLSNLIGNALKFVPAGRRPVVAISAVEHERRKRVSIRDNGIGIPPEHRARLFHIFERLHGGAGYEGTGIGLSIVKKAVEKMNGTVGVESEPGSGSTFWFELPTEARG